MKTRLNRISSVFLTVVMLLTAAPLSGFTGLDLNLDWLNFTTKVSAESYSGTCGNDITWTFDDSTGELLITGTGTMKDYQSKNSPWEAYEGDIKSVVIGSGVTTIGENLFYNCDNLTSVTIPDTVTLIGEYVFWDCDSLTSMVIPDGVTMIGDYAFACCDKLANVTIGQGVNTVRARAFLRCPSLTSITLPDSVHTIERSAFEECTGLTSVTIGKNVTLIGEYAFAYCSNISDLILNSGTVIGADAFYNCVSLKS